METARKLIEAELGQVSGLPELCAALREVRDLKRALGVWDDHLSDQIAELMPGKWDEVEGVGLVEVKRGAKRTKWDHDALSSLVVARALDERKLDESTGEYEREAEAVSRVLRECAAFSYWRVTKLRERGIDPDEYAETQPGRVSVVLP